MLKKIFAVVLILVLAFVGLRHTVVSAHTVLFIPWYKYTYEIDQKTLPRGISIFSDTPKESKTYAIKFVNKGTSPFYLTVASDLRYKLIDNKAYVYNGSQDWVLMKMESAAGAVVPVPYLLVDENILRSYGVVISNGYEDDRPQNTKAPAPIPFTITTLLDDVPYSIKGRVVFRLNLNYVTHALPANSEHSAVPYDNNEASSSVPVQQDSKNKHSSSSQSSTTVSSPSSGTQKAASGIPVNKGIFHSLLNFFRGLWPW